MTKEELLAKVNFQPIDDDENDKVEYSTKLTPYTDNVRSFACHYVNGRTVGAGNVLAKENNDAAFAMCKDAKK